MGEVPATISAPEEVKKVEPVAHQRTAEPVQKSDDHESAQLYLKISDIKQQIDREMSNIKRTKDQIAAFEEKQRKNDGMMTRKSTGSFQW